MFIYIFVLLFIHFPIHLIQQPRPRNRAVAQHSHIWCIPTLFWWLVLHSHIILSFLSPPPQR
ncbi:uncharacterized protein K452DRAFT_159273 [Aplosporella prunicola CBS 121167]|uniref:Uncharacterized protein n=1 Tax=Aplosporella prunicola CBS 121167 TaxID=1176127 RepID=A0A6A6BJJ7_9PEZI|nr:uncharacterized protein K452DRAFT_159273 [Aplosporella prunicola CBS 121167]KAF2143553.1 hypothetical protein K452DRAFT_159273 [Aplosporella prunicola CBS 121167]